MKTSWTTLIRNGVKPAFWRRRIGSVWWLPVVFLLVTAATVKAGDYTYAINDNTNTITIIAYNGSGGAVDIPSTIDDLTVTSIGEAAFSSYTSLNSVTIPNSVTSIGYAAFNSCTSLNSVTLGDNVTRIWDFAFNGCSSLASITFGNSVTYIGPSAFDSCTSLNSITIPSSVTEIGYYAFEFCSSLTSVTLGNSITSIGDGVFNSCTNLTGVFFKGNAPGVVGSDVFAGATNATVFYLPGTTGWDTPFSGLTPVPWNPQVRNDAKFGVQTNRFGFAISATNNMVVVVEACTNLVDPIWSPVGTNTFGSDTSYFGDPQWTNYPVRFYRLRMP